MANLIRSAKSGSDWTLSDLDSYNIELHRENHLAFFGVQALPPPQVDPELMNTAEADDMVQDRNAELINLLDLAMTHRSGECAVDDFAVELFKALGYVRRNRVARTRKDLSLLVCGERRHAQTDVCIVDRHQNDIILLVQEDKRVEGGENVDARAQLVAEAIAAFTENNMNREVAELPPFSEKVIPGITMMGTTPAFFKIPVTEQLVYHVRNARRYSEGMKPLDNRRSILSCYEAFKAIVGIVG